LDLFFGAVPRTPKKQIPSTRSRLEKEIKLSDPKIMVLIPAHNEHEHITAVAEAACQHLPVLVVDDGSTDDTARLAEAAGARVLRQSPNQGKGAALIAGFRACLADGCDAVITLDGDGQHDPAEIPRFLDYYSSHRVGLIVGQRQFSKMPLLRRTTNSIGRIMFSWAVSRPIPDNQSGYRLATAPLMQLLVDSDEKGFELEVDMITLCLKHNLGLGWVPIRTIYAGQASHIRKFHHLVHYFRIVFKARRTIHRK
jgi:glycosyltransferase involved in cell wall biosynthesis